MSTISHITSPHSPLQQYFLLLQLATTRNCIYSIILPRSFIISKPDLAIPKCRTLGGSELLWDDQDHTRSDAIFRLPENHYIYSIRLVAALIFGMCSRGRLKSEGWIYDFAIRDGMCFQTSQLMMQTDSFKALLARHESKPV